MRVTPNRYRNNVPKEPILATLRSLQTCGIHSRTKFAHRHVLVSWIENMKLFNVFKMSIALGMCAPLVACYVVPVQPGTPPRVMAVVPVNAAPVNFPARLYPANDKAAPYGAVTGTITSDLNGRGHFGVSLGSEYFQGEATRAPGANKGMANATGSRGNYLNCQYQMNSSTLGSGQCQHADGAQFTLHIGP